MWFLNFKNYSFRKGINMIKVDEVLLGEILAKYELPSAEKDVIRVMELLDSNKPIFNEDDKKKGFCDENLLNIRLELRIQNGDTDKNLKEFAKKARQVCQNIK